MSEKEEVPTEVDDTAVEPPVEAIIEPPMPHPEVIYEPTPEKPKRGRPRKVVVEPEEMPPPPKRRGRPPKTEGEAPKLEPTSAVRMHTPMPVIDYHELTRNLALHLADVKTARKQAKVESWNQFFV